MTEKQYDFAVVGGDKRLVYLSDLLRSNGYHVIEYKTYREENADSAKTQACSLNGKHRHNASGLTGNIQACTLEQAVRSAGAVIGPVPLTRDGETVTSRWRASDLTVSNLFAHTEGTLFAGCIPPDLTGKGEKSPEFIYDLMTDEELTEYNTIATAEGAIAEAVIRHPGNLHKSRCLVLGFGRCGSILAHKLSGLSAKVTICARKPGARAIADAYGYKSISFDRLKSELPEFDYIFNTVPAVVLDRGHLTAVGRDAIVIDLASRPGGVDYKAAEELGKAAYQCLGLPGKYAPEASAKAMAKVILAKLNKE